MFPLRFCADFGGFGGFPPNNLRVLCEHLHLPKAQQVEFKARIIAMTFAVNFYLLGHRYKTYAATNAEVHEKSDTTIVFFCAFVLILVVRRASPPSNLRVLCEHLHLPKPQQVEFKARMQ